MGSPCRSCSIVKEKGLEVVPVNVDRASEPPGGGGAALHQSITHTSGKGKRPGPVSKDRGPEPSKGGFNATSCLSVPSVYGAINSEREG